MATLTIRNVPQRTVKSLKALARRNGHSMEQEVRDLLETWVSERAAVLEQIEGGWAAQSRRPSGAEVDRWITTERA
jgi:plasmid stability protein